MKFLTADEMDDTSADSSSGNDSENDSDYTLDEPPLVELRRDYGKMTSKEQEDFDHDAWNTHQLLALDPKKIYNVEDLEDETVLARALCLLYLAKFGQNRLYTRISPHVKYDKLPVSLSQAIKKSLISTNCRYGHYREQ